MFVRRFENPLSETTRFGKGFQFVETLVHRLSEGFQTFKRIPPREAKVQSSCEPFLRPRCDILARCNRPIMQRSTSSE